MVIKFVLTSDFVPGPLCGPVFVVLVLGQVSVQDSVICIGFGPSPVFNEYKPNQSFTKKGEDFNTPAL